MQSKIADPTGLISVKLHELLVEDLDAQDSQVNRLIDNLALNIILTKLNKSERVKFYEYLVNGRQEEARNLINTNIPNFNVLVTEAVENKMGDSL